MLTAVRRVIGARLPSTPASILVPLVILHRPIGFMRGIVVLSIIGTYRATRTFGNHLQIFI